MVHQLPLVGAIAAALCAVLLATVPAAAQSTGADLPLTDLGFYSQSHGDHPAGIGWAFHDSNGYPDFGRVDALGEDQAREPAHLRNIAAKRYMLELTNAERTRAGLAPVVLGNNVGAQLHAEAALAHCFIAHWDLHGLKPYMRYSLSGGYQSNSENLAGTSYCITDADGYRPLTDIEQAIREAMEGWLASPAHRRNILDTQHRQVNIGLAWDRYNIKIVQHLQGDYVTYRQLPILEDGTLVMAGTVRNGVRFEAEQDLGIRVFYDPPPHGLTPGQLARTHCYDSGLPVASLRYPLTGNQYWPEQELQTTYTPCPHPADAPTDAPPPRSVAEAHRLWEAVSAASRARVAQTVTVPWITAREWTADGHDFALRADLSAILAEYGNGVYTVVVWGIIAGKHELISTYSIFHGVTPPDTYAAATP